MIKDDMRIIIVPHNSHERRDPLKAYVSGFEVYTRPLASLFEFDGCSDLYEELDETETLDKLAELKSMESVKADDIIGAVIDVFEARMGKVYFNAEYNAAQKEMSDMRLFGSEQWFDVDILAGEEGYSAFLKESFITFALKIPAVKKAYEEFQANLKDALVKLEKCSKPYFLTYTYYVRVTYKASGERESYFFTAPYLMDLKREKKVIAENIAAEIGCDVKDIKINPEFSEAEKVGRKPKKFKIRKLD